MSPPTAALTTLAAVLVGYVLGSLHLLRHLGDRVESWAQRQATRDPKNPLAWVALACAWGIVAAHPVDSWRNYQYNRQHPRRPGPVEFSGAMKPKEPTP